MADKKPLVKEFTKGLIAENPVLRLVLGTCPTLAVSTSVMGALGMGAAASIVLICSNFVTIVQMLVKAFVPEIDKSLGVYLPLIVVNCIILGRAEAFAGKNSIVASALDGMGMGVGFTAALLAMAFIRELIGTGAINGIQIFPADFSMLIFILPPGGFFVFGMLIALANKLAEKKGKPKAELHGCESCPMAASCSLINNGENCDVKEATVK